MKLNKLTNRELDIMKVLWGSEESQTAAEILSKINDDKISIFTVQNTLKSLLKKNIIEITSITMVNKSNARKYSAKITADDYAVEQFKSFYPNKGKNATISELTLALVKAEKNQSQEDALLEIEAMIKKLQGKQ